MYYFSRSVITCLQKAYQIKHGRVYCIILQTIRNYAPGRGETLLFDKQKCLNFKEYSSFLQKGGPFN
jgi:hypothetical protein